MAALRVRAVLWTSGTAAGLTAWIRERSTGGAPAPAAAMGSDRNCGVSLNQRLRELPPPLPGLGHRGDGAGSPGAALQAPGVGVLQGIAWGGGRWGQATHPQGQPGMWDSCPGIPSLPGCGNWAVKVSAVLWEVGLGREPALGLMPPTMDPVGSLTVTEERRWELKELGLFSSPHPHPRLPLDTAVEPVRMRLSRVTSGSGNSPCPGPGDSSLGPGFSSTPSGSWMGRTHHGVGKGGAGSAAFLVWADRCRICLRGAQGALKGCSGSPLGVMAPRWLCYLHPLKVEGSISAVRGWWDRSCCLLWG